MFQINGCIIWVLLLILVLPQDTDYFGAFRYETEFLYYIFKKVREGTLTMTQLLPAWPFLKHLRSKYVREHLIVAVEDGGKDDLTGLHIPSAREEQR